MEPEDAELQRAVLDAVTRTSIRAVARELGIPRTAVHDFIHDRPIADRHHATIEDVFAHASASSRSELPDGPDLPTLRAAAAALSLREVAAGANVSKTAVSDFVDGNGTPRARTVLALRRWYWDRHVQRGGAEAPEPEGRQQPSRRRRKPRQSEQPSDEVLVAVWQAVRASSVDQVAAAVGMKPARLARWLRGDPTPLRAGTVQRLRAWMGEQRNAG